MKGKEGDSLLETDLVNYLKTYQPLNDLIAGRIYPGVLPENGTKPAVAYNEVSAPGHHDIDVSFPRFQFSCFSPKYIEAKQVRKEIENALKRFRGMMGNTRVIQGVVAGKYELYENDTKLHNAIIDIKIIYWE
ncbi:tail completion protein gp17 [Neobacillus massiliamazoniensis]|uniref:DUF3168 domain-containing protein n=1 Tax=Neobacillus massiliamazoniensis TaxID=1499688 RepID=A0A0U1NQI5_9BACI|nr:DUF3168 domain-containing protein [Neobacillus massiliamazoniensis]CRK80306.1 hypothetical protein BN000_00187 [Neobacillus massiliamazoniensis]